MDLLYHKQKQTNYNSNKERHIPPCLNCEFKTACLIPGPCLHNIYCVECGMVYLKERLVQKMPSIARNVTIREDQKALLKLQQSSPVSNEHKFNNGTNEDKDEVRLPYLRFTYNFYRTTLILMKCK